MRPSMPMQWPRLRRSVLSCAWRSGLVACALGLVTLQARALPERSTATADEDADPVRREAREIARQAIELMHGQRWAEAEPLLARAYRMVPAPTIALLDGETLEQLGRLTDA